MIEDIEEIEKIFNSDSREKKIISRGAFHRASRKKGYKGNVKFAHDNLKNKNLLNSEVRVYNMFEEIIPYQDFLFLNKEERKKRFEVWYNKYTIKEIAESWGTNKQKVHDARYQLGIQPRNRLMSEMSKLPRKQREPKEPKQKGEIQTMQNIEIIKPVDTNLYNVKFKSEITLTGKMQYEEIQERLTNIASVLMKNKEYEVILVLRETEGSPHNNNKEV